MSCSAVRSVKDKPDCGGFQSLTTSTTGLTYQQKIRFGAAGSRFIVILKPFGQGI